MILNHLKIIREEDIVEDGYLYLENQKIKTVSSSPYSGKEETIDCHHLICMPGFVDIHIHGSNGIDFMDCSVSDFKKAADSLYQEGVTSFLATTLTAPKEELIEVARKVKLAQKEVPSLAGIHLEGPYISKEFKGAQNEAYIRNPDVQELDELISASGNAIKDITLAPEKEGMEEFISYASKKGITLSAGHSGANFKDVEKAIQWGLSNVTHVHNGMSGYHHRHPGIVTASMYFDSLLVEMIGDGVHVCPETMKTLYKIVGPERLILISDALKIKHSEIINFKLEGLDCIKKEDAAYLISGPLCGSILSMDQAVRNMKKYCHCSLNELAKISSSNATKSIHLDDRGEIKEGKLADLVLLDDELNVISTFKEGKEVYSKK